MNPQTAKYYVILVHFGSPKPTDQALYTLLTGQKTPTEVIIIDHAHQPYSWNGSQPVSVLRPQQNAGYGAGVNIGLGFLLKRKLAEHDIVIVMNNDVVVGPTTLSLLTTHYSLQPTHYGLVGVRGGRIKWFSGRTQLDKKPADYLDGAFLAATYQTWGKLSGMPDKYFMYWEDVALGARARQRGITLSLLPDITIKHQPAHQHQETTDRLYHLVKSGARFLERETPLPWRLFWWPKNRLRYVYHRWFSRGPKASIITRALYDAITS